MFDIVQGLWNSVLSEQVFIDARFSYNKIFFPLFQNGDGPDAARSRDRASCPRNAAREQIFIRKRFQANATCNYYIDHALGGRHEIRFGFDHAHMPTSTNVHRIDDVTLTYATATNAPVAGDRSSTRPSIEAARRRRRRSTRRTPTRIEQPDTDRRPALGAGRGLPARAVQPAEPVVPEPRARVRCGPRHRRCGTPSGRA